MTDCISQVQTISCENLVAKRDLTINPEGNGGMLTEFRKIHTLGDSMNSCRIVIPKHFAEQMKVGHGSYLKMVLDGKKIVMEKMEDLE